MPSATPRGYPYPLPTEPVAEGAAAIRALAEKVDANVVDLIQTIKLSSAGPITFLAIPQTYAHLLAVGSVRCALGATNDPLGLRFNNDSGPGYRSQQTNAVAGGPPNTSAQAPSGFGYCGHAPGSTSAPASWFNAFELLIPSYRDTGQLRSWLSRGFSAWGAADMSLHSFGGFFWGAPAVTRLDIFGVTAPNSLAVGSRISLYGLNGGVGAAMLPSLPEAPETPEPK